MVLNAVISFFEAQNLDFKLRPREKPRTYYNGQRLITKEQILTLYDGVGEEHRLRNRAIILTLKGSGLRVSDLCAINVEDYATTFVRHNDVGETFKTFRIDAVKTGIPTFVYLEPESIEDVNLYLADLRNEGPTKTRRCLISEQEWRMPHAFSHVEPDMEALR